jgi:hypothetical protein
MLPGPHLLPSWYVVLILCDFQSNYRYSGAITAHCVVQRVSKDLGHIPYASPPPLPFRRLIYDAHRPGC